MFLNFKDKPHCRVCETVLEELENIDDECGIYGIHMVKIQDIPLAKRYGIRTFPALMYFRNGNPLLFDGTFHTKIGVHFKFLINYFTFIQKQKGIFETKSQS